MQYQIERYEAGRMPAPAAFVQAVLASGLLMNGAFRHGCARPLSNFRAVKDGTYALIAEDAKRAAACFLIYGIARNYVIL